MNEVVNRLRTIIQQQNENIDKRKRVLIVFRSVQDEADQRRADDRHQ